MKNALEPAGKRAQTQEHNNSTKQTTTPGSTAPDYAAAECFLTALDSSQSVFDFRLIYPGSRTIKLRGKLPGLWPELVHHNSWGAGVYVVVNAGGDKAADITRVRAVFADLDDAPPDKAVHTLPPSMFVSTSPGKFHVYWFVGGLAPAEFKPLQKAIAALVGGDPSVCDLPRVMRLPGLNHTKGEPCPVRLLHVAQVRYTADQIRAAFPSADQPALPPSTSPPATVAPVDVVAALRHIDPGTCRADYIAVLAAIKSATVGQPDAEAIAHAWAAGEHWQDGCPPNYAGPDDVARDWRSLQADRPGGVTVATLYYRALQGGWSPPAGVDTAAAFGAGAAPADTFAGLVDKVQESGGDQKETQAIIDAIKAAGCNNLQTALLAETLKDALRSNGVKSGTVGKLIDQLLPVATVGPLGELPSIPEPDGGALEFDGLAVGPLPLCGDDVQDAYRLHARTFNGRLQVHDNRFCWWSGCAFSPVDDAEVRRAIGHALTGGARKATQSRVKALLEASRDHAPRLLTIDPPRLLVFFENCVIDIKTRQRIAHSPTHCNSRTLSVNFEPEATCPTLWAWLADIFAGEPERVELLQELLGWMLTRSNLGIEKAVLLIGPTRAGKGLVIRLLSELLGAAGAVPISLACLDDPKGLSAMRWANVAIDADAVSPHPRNGRQVMGLFKSITSNDSVSVPLLYRQSPWAGPLNCKLLLAANSVPALFDDSAATGNRWLPLVFDQSYLGREDPGLFEKLRAELPGIAVWALQGLQRLAQRGRFELPQSSRDKLEVLCRESGPLADFVEECLALDGGAVSTEDDAWAAYARWTIAGGYPQQPRRVFLKALEDSLQGAGVRRVASVPCSDGRRRRGFRGVGVTTGGAANVTAFKRNR